MSIQLTKRVESVGIVLAKRGVTKAPPIRVGLALDVSGSAEWMYTNGTMQETVNRVQAVALKFDDNGELDMWAFSNATTQLPAATADDEGTYLGQHINYQTIPTLWRGTEYGPCIESVTSYYYPDTQAKKKGFFGNLFSGGKPATSAPTEAQLPAMLLFVTDGDANDKEFTESVLTKISEDKSKNIFFMMVGVGSASSFAFLKHLDKMHANVGYVNLAALTISDDELYDKLVSQKFADWIRVQ